MLDHQLIEVSFSLDAERDRVLNCFFSRIAGIIVVMTHEIVPIVGELGDLLHKDFASPACERFVRVDGVVLPEHYEQFADAIENFQVRDDDVWVCSFPKTGTTWTQEMVWSILNDIDSEEAKVTLSTRFPYFEISQFMYLKNVDMNNFDAKIPPHMIDSVSFVRDLPSPRFIKCHLPFHLLPRQLRNAETKAKIVYVVRNPKDACISYYHHFRLMSPYEGSFEDWCNLFVGDTVHYAPFWGHALGFWKKRINENLLFLKFEDMKEDLPRVIKKTATFLGRSLTSDQLSKLADHLSFATMKKNPAVNNEDLVMAMAAFLPSRTEGKFMRCGNADQWKTAMTPEVVQQFDDWTRESLKGANCQLY